METREEFIAFFEAIPEERWTACSLLDEKGRCCVLGHLGFRDYYPAYYESIGIDLPLKKESIMALAGFLNSGKVCGSLYEAESIIYEVNDRGGAGSPKRNILNALKNGH